MAIAAHIALIQPRAARVTPQGVAAFNKGWPCSELDPSRSYYFAFDSDWNHVDNDVPEEHDGGAASALCDDVRAWLRDGTQAGWF